MMLLTQLHYSSTLVLAAAAPYGASMPVNSTAATSTASLEVTSTPEAGRVSLFPDVEDQWSQELVDELRPSERQLLAFETQKEESYDP